MDELLREFTDRAWDYDTICCAICEGGALFEDRSDGTDHNRHVFDHRSDCLWVRAHRLLGRDLGPHTVEV